MDITELVLHTGNSYLPAHNERVSLTHFDGKLCLLGITKGPTPSHDQAITRVTPRASGGAWFGSGCYRPSGCPGGGECPESSMWA